VDVANQVSLGPNEHLEGRLTGEPGQHAAIWRNAKFFDPGRSPVFFEQAAKQRRELRAGFDASQLGGAGGSDFGRLTHGGILAGVEEQFILLIPPAYMMRGTRPA